MRPFQRMLACAAALFIVAAHAAAHPGHGMTSADSVVHYVVEPSHAWGLLALLAMGAGTWVYRSSRRLRQQRAVAPLHPRRNHGPKSR